MPSGCAALPAKKTTDAEGPCMRLAQSYHAFGGSAPAKAEISGLMKMLADAGLIASQVVAYDVAHVLARGKVARHGLLDAALAGVGHAHADRSASGARLIADSRRSTLPKLARQHADSRGFVRSVATGPNRPTRRRLWSRGCDGFASSRSCLALPATFDAGSRRRSRPQPAMRDAGPRCSSLLSRRKRKAGRGFCAGGEDCQQFRWSISSRLGRIRESE